MTVQKVTPKDPKKENEKYLIFLDFILDKLKNGRPAGISLRNLASDYKTEMSTTLDRTELKEFEQLYDGLYFDKVKSSIDRIKIKNKTIRILFKYGSIREYLKQQNNNQETTNKNFAKKLIDFSIGGIWIWLERVSIVLTITGVPGLLYLCSDSVGKSTPEVQQETQTHQSKTKTASTDSINILETDSLLNN